MMIKHKFNVGDIVNFTVFAYKTYKGKVIGLNKKAKRGERDGIIRVAFGDDFNGWSWGKYKNCWNCSADELEIVSRKDKEKPMKHKFKFGDIVGLTENGKEYVGTFVRYSGTDFAVISFDKNVVLNNVDSWEDTCSEHGYYEFCHSLLVNGLKLVSRKGKEKYTDKSKEIKIIVNEPAVIAIRGDKKGVAKCNPADTFDVAIGSKLAIERLIEAENGHWVPSNGEKYFMVFEPFHIVSSSCVFSPSVSMIDNVNLALGNMFKTTEEAEAHKEEIKTRFDMMIKYAEGLANGK